MKRILVISLLLIASTYAKAQPGDSTLKAIKVIRTLLNEDKVSEALTLTQSAILKDSTSAELFCLRGQLQLENKDHKAAYESFNLALKINGEYAEGYFQRGIFFYRVGEPQLAIMDFNDVLVLSKEDTLVKAAILNRGNAHYMSGNKEKALHDFDTLISIDPARISYRNNKAATLSSLGKHKEAIKMYNEIIAMDKKYANAYFNQGYEWIVLKDYKMSVTITKKGLKLDKKNAVGWNNMGQAYLEMGNTKKALKYVNKSIQLNSSNAYAYRNLGHIHLKNGNKSEACEAWKRAEKLDFKYIFGTEVDKLLKKHCKRPKS